MYITAFLFACALTVSYSEKVVPISKTGQKCKAGTEDNNVLYQHRYSGALNNNHQDHPLGIIDGQTTNITQHPFQVAIDSGKTFVCAGALLNRIWVVALASCTGGCVTSMLTVRVGSNSDLYGGTMFNVADIVIHPQFDYSKNDYDFSLLKLSTYLCFDQYVSQISFSFTPPPRKVTGFISGWGYDKKKPKNVFRQLKMHTISNQWCANKYNVTHDVITTRMFCAVAVHSGPCYNDFGDPFVVNGTLYGLYSWSRGCANPNFPAVFASLASVKDWIHSVMNDACVCGVY